MIYCNSGRPTPDEVAANCDPADLDDKIRACELVLSDDKLAAHDRTYFESVRDKLMEKKNG